jgi:hypothetical protein
MTHRTDRASVANKLFEAAGLTVSEEDLEAISESWTGFQASSHDLWFPETREIEPCLRFRADREDDA